MWLVQNLEQQAIYVLTQMLQYDFEVRVLYLRVSAILNGRYFTFALNYLINYYIPDYSVLISYYL